MTDYDLVVGKTEIASGVEKRKKQKLDRIPLPFQKLCL